MKKIKIKRWKIDQRRPRLEINMFDTMPMEAIKQKDKIFHFNQYSVVKSKSSKKCSWFYRCTFKIPNRNRLFLSAFLFRACFPSQVRNCLKNQNVSNTKKKHLKIDTTKLIFTDTEHGFVQSMKEQTVLYSCEEHNSICFSQLLLVCSSQYIGWNSHWNSVFQRCRKTPVAILLSTSCVYWSSLNFSPSRY